MALNGAIVVDIVADMGAVTRGLEGIRGLANGVFGDLRNYAGLAFGDMKRFSERSMEGAVRLFDRGFSPVGEYLAGGFKKAVELAAEGLKDLRERGAKPLESFCRESLRPGFEGTVLSIMEKTGGMKNSFGELLAYVSGIFTPDWGGAWNGIGKIFGETWRGMEMVCRNSANTIIGCVNRMVKGVWDGLLGIVNAVGQIAGSFGDWLGFSGWGFKMPSAPQIPMLAGGGIVTAPTLAMVGERGREAVLPLENHTGWMGDLANMVAEAVAAAMVMNKGTGGSINLYIDGRKMAEAVVEDFNDVYARKGIEMGMVRR